MQQREVRQELRQVRRCRDRFMDHPLPRQRGAGNAQQQRRGEGHHQLQVAAPQHRQRMFADFQPAVRREAARREEAADHQEHLDRDAGVVVQPVHQSRGEAVCRVGHRAVESEVVQHDQLGADRLERVDAGQS
ncbi:hypothetical protein D3C81_1338250 [compost metagenome]